MPLPRWAAASTIILGFASGASATPSCGTCRDASSGLEPMVRQALSAVAGPFGPALPVTAAADAGIRALGTKRVLVLRVDFSDVPGPAASAATVQSVLDAQVKPFLENASYGRTSITSTVSSAVYRLPRTAASYALEVFSGPRIISDAKTAAAADYAVASFDRLMVLFPYIGPGRIPGSLFIDGAAAIVSGDETWVNGTFSAALVAHELGHNFGLWHANLWQVTDGNPVSMGGKSLEYGDPFDLMGTDFADGRNDFNMWAKQRLGWLPDTAVRAVTASGTYRVYRFDHRDALSLNQPLALKIARDGQRSYWVGLRQGTGNASLANGAYILWGYDANHPTELLDLTTPGSDATDAALGLGRTFIDPVYGISIKPLARGGSEPAQYLDVEIVVPVVLPDAVRGWHMEGGTTFVPPGVIDVRAIAADDSQIFAVKNDGTVIGWWFNGPLAEVPAGITNAISVAAGGGAYGVVRADGTVHLWGPAPNATAPAALANVRQIAFGRGHTLVLKNDGTVVAWGLNDSGQATVPAGLQNVVAIAGGYGFSAALKNDGTIVRWGSMSGEVPLPAGLDDVIAIASTHSAKHLVALRANGTVVVAGANELRQASVPAGLANVVAVAAGTAHSLALRADGTVVAWGSNSGYVPPGLPRVFGFAANSQANFVLTGSGAFITEQPKGQTVAAGAATTLSLNPSALAKLTFQWRKDGVPIPGATASSLTLANPAPADAGYYDCVVASPINTTVSFPARLSVVAPLTVNTQPRAQQVELGRALTLSAAATGAGPITYQWRKDGAILAGATNATLTIASASAVDAATYDVVISDGVSRVTTAAVDVATFPAARISNLSIRSRTGPGAQTLIVGFVIGGASTLGAKPLLLRGAGPALAAFGVTDPLADPRLELFAGSTRLAENDNWAGNALVTSAGTRVGAFGFGAASADAALYQEIGDAGIYSMQITGAGAAQGVALAEVYDASNADTFSVNTRRLVNISARTEVGTGGSILIAGFTVSGRNGRTLLIRGVGPTLSGFGVSGALADPRLELYDGAAVKLLENDNWSSASGIADVAATVGAFPLPPNSRDAALLATLPAGNFTVQVSGVANTTGTALVEIYEVPQ